MAANYDKDSESIIINGYEQGIQSSPHKGIANLQNVNISTETGEVTNSFARLQDTMTNTVATGTLSFVDTSHVALSIANTNNLFKGNWIVVTNSSHTGELPNGTYYVPPSAGTNFQLSKYYNTLGFTLPASISYTIVGGGGGGGTGNSAGAGGGGGGGQVKNGTTTVTAQAYAITIGTGGATDVSGNASSAISISSAGGVNGGQGNTVIGGPGGASGSGVAGGTAIAVSSGAGGGGDSHLGINATGAPGGTGGDGTASTITGSSVLFGPGGGGGGQASGTGAGGSGGATGGGSGGTGSNSSSHPGVAAIANTGGGGGGGGGLTGGGSNVGGVGGSGLVQIRYVTGAIIGATGGSITTELVSNVSYTLHTFNASDTFTVPAPPTVSPLTGFTTGLTATISMVATMGKPIAYAVENYYASGIPYNRYYVLDNNNLVWVYDTINEVVYSSSDKVMWFLPDYQTGYATMASGIAVISGFLVVTTETGLYGKPTTLLGNTNSVSTTWVAFVDVGVFSGSGANSPNPHFAYVGHQGALYYTDGAYVGEVFPDSTLATAGVTGDNVQTACSWTSTGASPTQGTFSLISGVTGATSDNLRLPAVFFTINGGVLPTSMTTGTVYYINAASGGGFSVYAAATGGSALDIYTGAIGTQYFNTFYPIASASAWDGGTPTYVYTPQRLNLPKFEISQSIVEVGNLILIGNASNIIYPWNQLDNLPSNIINVPESNVQSMVTAHQMVYIFAGNKGNIYITDGSVASSVTTVPDYCAGIPGTPSSYIEPVFNWGGTMYLRGKIYFSILDQTSIKTGNCGGVWSFVPTQNLYIGQDVGIALHMENQSSYSTYNGYASLLIPKVNQNAIAPQYFSGWESDISTPTYGIDATGTGTASTSVGIIETDLIETGTLFDKKTFDKTVYKLTSPLANGAIVALNYRVSATDAWTSCGTLDTDSTELSGYYPVNFQKTEWIQLQAILTPTTASPGTFIRLSDIRLRP